MSTGLTPTEIQKLWDETYRSGKMRAISLTSYTGTGHSARPDKTIFILLALHDGGQSVMVGDRGTRGPALLKSGVLADVRKFKSTAYFNLKNAGFEKENTKVVERQLSDAKELWNTVFAEHHSKSIEAKTLFLKLCGVDIPEDSGKFKIVMNEAAKIEEKREAVVKKSEYEGNPIYGRF